MRRERLKTPPNQFGLLIEPDADGLLQAAQSDHAASLAGVTLGKVSATDIRHELREQLGFRGPVVLTGHQVEFFHPGVLAKTIAIDALRQRLGGSGVFLATDADLPKQTMLVLPRGRNSGIALEQLELPGIASHLPIESQPRSQRVDWLKLFTRVGNVLGEYEARMMQVFSSAWIFSSNDSINFARCMQAARVACEKKLGLEHVQQITLSNLAQTSAYRHFLADLIQQAPRFAQIHNKALSHYQKQFAVRNPHRPVAPLLIQGDYIELPFWVYAPGGQRQRLGVIAGGEYYKLMAGSEQIGELSQSDLITDLIDLAPWQIRPRALTLTMFIRLLLSDLFVHGIGGAKYDEVTDTCAREFYGVKLPPIACVSATLRLDLPRNDVSTESLRASEREVRDVRFNPQRYTEDLPEDLLEQREALIRQSEQLRQSDRHNRSSRRQVFEQIQAINLELNQVKPRVARRLRDQCEMLRQQLADNRWADHREYFFGLFLTSDLERLCSDLRQALGVNH